MKFLVLLLTYVVQRKFEMSLSRLHDHWADQFLVFFEGLFPVIRHHTTLYLLIAIFLPALLLFIILSLLENQVFGLATLVVNFLVLFMCLGCGYLKPAVEGYLKHWQNGDASEALNVLQDADIHLDNPENLSAAEVHYQVLCRFMSQTFHRYFMVIFWFMLAGPVGALVARLAHVSAVQPSVYRPQHVKNLGHLLEWIPARLLTFTFALVGNFTGATRQSLSSLIDPYAGADEVLQRGAAGGLDNLPLEVIAGPAQPAKDAAQLVSLRELMNRALVVWLAVLAMLTISGWMG